MEHEAPAAKVGGAEVGGATPTRAAAAPESTEPVRCWWAVDRDGTRAYRDYHDHEWGKPVHERNALYERIVLEGFQSGLSWLTVLRKRPAFREDFAGFDPDVVARFTDDDVDRLLADPRIIRNRSKIEAAIANAKAIVGLKDTDLDALLWSFAPTDAPPRPRCAADVPAQTAESAAMAKELKRRGFRFIGPVTAYALMQAVGMVDDHTRDCEIR